MEYCIFCGKEIEKDSEEHILLNSLGGKLVAKNLICNKCNNFFGREIDPKLSDVLYPYATLLNVKRDRGNNKNILTNDDTDYYIKPMGVPALKKPKISVENIDRDKYCIMIEASENKQVKQAIKQIKSKYGNRIDEHNLVIERKKEFLNEKIPFKVKISPEMFPSIIKTAIEFCKVKSDVDISDAIRRFNNKDYSNCYYCFDDLVKVDFNSIFHFLYLFTYNESLYCYVNYFGIIGFIVILTDNISISIEESYIYDLISGSIVTTDYKLSKNLINSFKYNNSFTPDDCDRLKRKNINFNSFYYKISRQTIIKRLIDEVMDEDFSNNHKCISEPDNIAFSKKFLEKITPYLIYWMKE